MYLLTPGREETSSTTLECVSVGGGVLELMEGDGAGGCRRRGQILTHLQTRNTPDPSFTRSPGGMCYSVQYQCFGHNHSSTSQL